MSVTNFEEAVALVASENGIESYIIPYTGMTEEDLDD